MEEFTKQQNFITWLEGMKFNIDTTSPTMTEDFEKEHKWELSRNYIIDKIINKIVKVQKGEETFD